MKSKLSPYLSFLSRLAGMCFVAIVGSVIIFILSNSIPQDSIDVKLANLNLTQDNANYNSEYEKYYKIENKNLPLFYFSILPNTYHPNHHMFINKKERNLLIDLQEKGYDCTAISPMSNLSVASLKLANYHYPKIHFYGLQNQYHSYISSVLKGDLGLSKKDGKKVWQKISTSLNWTIVIIVIGLLLSIFLSFIISFYLLKYDGGRWEKIFSGLSLLIFSIPGFWLATLVLIFFTGDQYGMPIFYTPLYIEVDDSSLISILTKGFAKILPIVFCITLLDVAYLTRILKVNLKEEMQKPYIISLKSRGLTWNNIVKRHAYPNVYIPILTLLIGSIPTAIAGSLVFEIVFNVPGMGRLLHESIYTADWNVVYAIVLFILIITIILYAIADILYKKLDPRI